jgi:hypothetical protein
MELGPVQAVVVGVRRAMGHLHYALNVRFATLRVVRFVGRRLVSWIVRFDRSRGILQLGSALPVSAHVRLAMVRGQLTV